MRILIADADKSVRDILQSFLWDEGHEVEIAADGAECLAILRDFVPDVFVLDRNLLWGDCDEVLDLLGNDSELSQIPVILLETPAAVSPEMTNSSIVGRLQKPFRLREMQTKLQTLWEMNDSRSIRQVNVD